MGGRKFPFARAEVFRQQNRAYLGGMLPDVTEIFQANPPFERLSREVWDWQRSHNPVMRRFCELLGSTEPTFIPISFFKEFEMKVGEGWEPELIFESSGTTGQVASRHLVRDEEIYRESLLKGYRHFYGDESRTILALLPNYLEKGGSSLVHMVQVWMESFGQAGSGFYLYALDNLRKALKTAKENGERILLIGVSYALLDFAEAGGIDLPEDAIVMETGGMKGRRKEMVREELHATLQRAFGVPAIHSEYGMTELFSQAYGVARPGEVCRFHCPPWMQVRITDPYVPGRFLTDGRVGRINVVDLANLHSCAFIRTDDLGRRYSDGSFEVLGRLDHAELRGCNLLYA